MRRKQSRLLIFIITSFLSITFLYSSASAQDMKRIIIVHSYEKGHICGQPQHDGAIKALEEEGWDKGRNVEFFMYYMDTKKTNNTPELIARQGQTALKKIVQLKPDVVVTLDDNAFKTVGLPLSKSTLDIPVVFSGLNVQPEEYNRIAPFMKNRIHPGGNVTGIYEKLHIHEAIEVLASMYDIKTTIVLDDLSPTGKAIAKQVNLEINCTQGASSLPCTIERATIHSWEEYQEAIEMINKSDKIGAFYLGTLLLKDAQGNSYTAKDIINYTIVHAQKPAIGLNYSFIKLGLFGGASVDFYAMGKQAGHKVAKILSGEAPGSLSIDDAKKVALVFNLARSEKLGITIPPDILLAADEVFRK